MMRENNEPTVQHAQRHLHELFDRKIGPRFHGTFSGTGSYDLWKREMLRHYSALGLTVIETEGSL